MDRHGSLLGRRPFVLGISAAGLGLLAGCGRPPWQAQQPAKVARIGWLAPGAPGASTSLVDAFQAGLHDLGYVPGQDVLIEYRWAEGDLDRLPQLAAELVSLPADVLVTSSNPAAQAAREATRTIPIVMALSADPVGYDLVTTLARPGGNVTGLALYLPEFEGKRLELLKACLPGGARVGILGTATDARGEPTRRFSETQAAAQALGVPTVVLDVQRLADFDTAFEHAARARIDALFLLEHALVQANRSRVMDFATSSRLPGMFPGRDWVVDGGLMSYGASVVAGFRRAAYYVDRILKGAKPADLPVEQPMTFDFVVNMKTARELGITFPNEILLQVTEVIG
jgi:putative ABC transport system substrate-binding protein